MDFVTQVQEICDRISATPERYAQIFQDICTFDGYHIVLFLVEESWILQLLEWSSLRKLSVIWSHSEDLRETLFWTLSRHSCLINLCKKLGIANYCV